MDMLHTSIQVLEKKFAIAPSVPTLAKLLYQIRKKISFLEQYKVSILTKIKCKKYI